MTYLERLSKEVAFRVKFKGLETIGKGKRVRDKYLDGARSSRSGGGHVKPRGQGEAEIASREL